MRNVVEALDRAPVHGNMFLKPRDMPTHLEYYVEHNGAVYRLPQEHNADFNLAYLEALGIPADAEPKSVYDQVRKVSPDQAAAAGVRVYEKFQAVLQLVGPTDDLSLNDGLDELDEAPASSNAPKM